MSEITDREDELRALAKGCKTLQEFWKKTGWKDIQSAHRANELLKLNLPIIAAGPKAPPREAQAVPKPTKPAAKK